MSTIKVSTIKNLTETYSASTDTVAKLTDVSAVDRCKAWVNWNSIGTVAIRASYNCSSITDNGTGMFSVNFSTPLSDTKYSAVYTTGFGGATTCGIHAYTEAELVAAMTTSLVKFTSRHSAIEADFPINCVSIFR